jgi:hypothetical protein
MAAPLALGLLKILKAGGVAAGKTAIAGGTKGAIKASAKGAIKNTIKKKALGAAKNKFLKSNRKKVSKDKLLNTTSTGLVKYSKDKLKEGSSSSIIKRPNFGFIKQTNNLNSEELKDKKNSFDSILKVLDDIKNSLKNIESSIQFEIKSIESGLKNKRKELFKQKSAETESKLEENEKDKEEDDVEKEKAQPPSLFDRIFNYFSNILIGSLLNWGLNYLPQITEAFNAVIDAFENPLKRLKFSLITLTTVFPRFTRRVLSFSKKIFFGSAKFIGKLIFKAASLVKNLFTKAGKAIFNLIKEPLKRLLGPGATNLLKGIGQGVGSIFKKGAKGALTRTAAAVGGKGVAKAVSGTANAISKTAPAIFKRLKTFSKVFKRVPIIGALIGIGIDLAMGEPLDRAIVGAAGASLGAALGGLIGQGVIPIPVFGAAVGGFVGSAVGDWAAKSFYEYLKSKTSEAESEVKTMQGGGSTDKKIKTTRETSVVKREFIERKTQNIPQYRRSAPLDSNLVKESKEKVLSGENSSKRFVRVSNAFRSIPLVGELMNLGIAIGMGKRIAENDSRIAANQIANSIGNAIKNKKISGVDPRLAETISIGLSSWARKEILDQIRKKQSDFDIKQSDRDRQRGAGGRRRGGSQTPLEPSETVTGGNADFWTLAAIASLESGNPQGQADIAQSIYNRVASRSNFGQGNNHTIKGHVLAPGQYQPVRETRGGYGTWSRIVDKESAIQVLSSHPRGRNAAQMIERASANIKNPQLQKNAAEWVGGRTDFAVPSAANKYPGGLGFKTRHNHLFGWYVGPGSIAYGSTNPGPAIAPVLGDIVVMSSASSSEPNLLAPSSSSPQPSDGTTGSRIRGRRGRRSSSGGSGKKNKTIYLHWNAGNSNDAPSNYHTSILGSGAIRRITSYDNHNVSHTEKRNSNAIGISVSGMAGASPNNFGRQPIKPIQYQKMAEEAARVAKSWGWSAADIKLSNIMTHAEAGSNKDGRKPHDNYGPVSWGGSGERWDLFKLYQGDPDGSGGDKIRSLIKQKMGGSLTESSDDTTEYSSPTTNESHSHTDDSEDSSSQSNELPNFDKSKMWFIKGDKSNPRNKGFLNLNNTKSSETPKGGMGGGNSYIPSRKSSSSSTKVNNISKNYNFDVAKLNTLEYNMNVNNIISPTSKINIKPLNIKTSYEESGSTTIILMPPPQNTNSQIQTISGRQKIIPVIKNKEDNSFYKQMLTRALY